MMMMMMMMIHSMLLFATPIYFFVLGFKPVRGFSPHPTLLTRCSHRRDSVGRLRKRKSPPLQNPSIIKLFSIYGEDNGENKASSLKSEAEILRAKADELRSEIEHKSRSQQPNQTRQKNTKTDDDFLNEGNNAPESSQGLSSPWVLAESTFGDEDDRDYRLYVDIGREDGTWMDPRWGASGKRIEFALDIKLMANQLANPEISEKMINDNVSGKKSEVYDLKTAKFARLRNGFDRMECLGGAYRIDIGKAGSGTLRMIVLVEGTTRADQSYMYGDVSIPNGPLYFSLPCFGNSINNLSTKEGIVSVRQIGWHTGWRREESRICGIFTAKPLDDAKKRDSY